MVLFFRHLLSTAFKFDQWLFTVIVCTDDSKLLQELNLTAADEQCPSRSQDNYG